jgi:hypothetical protein
MNSKEYFLVHYILHFLNEESQKKLQERKLLTRYLYFLIIKLDYKFITFQILRVAHQTVKQIFAIQVPSS